MTFQDEFARRLNAVRGVGDGGEDAPDKSVRLERSRETGDGGDVSRLRSTRTGEDGEQTRHPELVSGPREAEPEDRGERDEVLKRVQDDDDTHIVKGDEHAPDNPVRLERSRETGDGRGVSRPWPVLSACVGRQSKGSTRTDRDNGGLNTVSGEPVERRLTSENRPSTSSGRTDQGDTPTPTPTTRHDGWHLDLRVKFLEALAQTGNVQASAYFVQRSRQSAYDLKRRDPDFARAWLAALVLAREEAQDKLQERAIEGVEEEIFYHGEVVATRRRYDSRLLLAHLARLDKIAEQIPAQRGAARFGDMLDAIGKGEDTAPLIATPTEEELAVLAAAAETGPAPEAPEEEGDEFYAVRWPDHDGPPDYYRMPPEEAATLEREVPGLTIKPTGTRDDAVINALTFHRDALAECGADEGHGEEEGMNL